MATECRTVARTLPADVDVAVYIEPHRAGTRLRIRTDYDPKLVKSVQIVTTGIDAAAQESR